MGGQIGVGEKHAVQEQVNLGVGSTDQSTSKASPRRTNLMEEPEIPDNNLWIVLPTLALITFVAALDQSIISTALPTIAEEFNTTPSEYSWIGTAYLLAQVMMNPINGRLTDIVGRKPALYFAVTFLLVFSTLCATAKSATWLIVARAFAGLGGGSIVSLSLIVISDIAPLEKRGAMQGYMAAIWGIAGSGGPVLGGALTAGPGWRWCFYINLPICALALALLHFFLKLKRTPRGDVAELRRSFDFIGLLLVMSGAALIIVGFSNAADFGFGDKTAYGVIIGGVVAMAMTVVHCLTTKKNAIIPARLLKTRTPLFFTFGSFFQSLMLMPVNFLLPQFFQGVQGASSLRSGVDLIPFSIGLSVFGVIAGEITTRLHIVRPVIWTGFALTALGFGLWYAFMTSTVSYATQEGLQILPAAGIGMAVSTPMLVIQASMPAKDMAASTAAWVLMRSLAASVGVAIFTAIFNTGLRSRFSKIEGYGTLFVAPTSVEGYKAIHELPEGDIKVQVLKAFADSMRVCWIIGCALICCALALTLCTKSYSMKRVYASSPDAEAPAPSSPTDEKADEKADGRINLAVGDVAAVNDDDDDELVGCRLQTQRDIDRNNREMLFIEDGLRETAASLPTSRVQSRIR
ncbi:hypothetical protein I317_05745 [Kwoniella heveanensis CBS 569]|nr:hypothetical protein I317_05745 [Kwoniella heveanensis CBS 569]